MHRRFPASAAAVILCLGCASTPGANPHDMSAANHSSHADQHGAAANAHAAEYDPEANRSKEHCAQGSASRDTLDACWTSVTNPTKEHLEQAELHRKHAADHRAASEALRAAEQKACAGIAPDARDISPFWHTDDVAGVERSSPNGVLVTFRAVPGMTVEWLQRAIDCHLARNAALGHDVPDMPDCPLVPKGVSAQVQSADKGFAVTLRSDDAQSASDMIARATRLERARPE
jgi:hypothetical protein